MIAYESLIDRETHVALVKGEVGKGEDVMVRVHSRCLTGDVFHSSRCDCGPQLESAMDRIAAEREATQPTRTRTGGFTISWSSLGFTCRRCLLSKKKRPYSESE